MAKLNLISHEIDPACAEVLCDLRTTSASEWTIRRGTGRWEIADGVIRGFYTPGSEALHGQIFHEKPLTGDVMLEFDARLPAPSRHDLVWLWQTSFESTPWGEGWLGCLGGWYGNYAGIEKLPTFEPSAIFAARPLETDRFYRIVSGSVGGIVFIALDGELLLRFADPHPVSPEKSGHIGFGLYQSNVEYRNIRVLRPHPLPRRPAYSD